MKRYSILAPALAIALAGCGSAGNPETALEAVRDTEQAQLQAIAAGDLRGAVRNYEDGALLVTPGRAPASGGEAIAAAFDEMLADPNLKVDVTPGPAWAAENGDLAVTTSTARYTTVEPGTGKPVEQTVSNQTVWRKAAGKAWMIVSDYNVELPSADSPTNAPAE